MEACERNGDQGRIDREIAERITYCLGLNDFLAINELNEKEVIHRSLKETDEETVMVDYDDEEDESEEEEEELKESEREAIRALRVQNLRNKPSGDLPVDETGQKITDDDMEFEDSSYSPSQAGEDDDANAELLRQEKVELTGDSSASAESSGKSVKILEFDDDGNISPKPRKK